MIKLTLALTVLLFVTLPAPAQKKQSPKPVPAPQQPPPKQPAPEPAEEEPPSMSGFGDTVASPDAAAAAKCALCTAYAAPDVFLGVRAVSGVRIYHLTEKETDEGMKFYLVWLADAATRWAPTPEQAARTLTFAAGEQLGREIKDRESLWRDNPALVTAYVAKTKWGSRFALIESVEWFSAQGRHVDKVDDYGVRGAFFPPGAD